jgi:hypothetical protein
LPELNAQPVLSSPYHAAMPAHLMALYSELELVRNGHAHGTSRGSPDFRKVTNRATIRAAIKFEGRAFQNAAPISPSVFVHVRAALFLWYAQVIFFRFVIGGGMLAFAGAYLIWADFIAPRFGLKTWEDGP